MHQISNEEKPQAEDGREVYEINCTNKWLTEWAATRSQACVTYNLINKIQLGCT